MMKLNKEKFLKTEFGSRLEECVIAWDFYLEKRERDDARQCQAQWEIYQLAMKQFYGVEYYFTRTDEYCGVCTEDETDWLLKRERKDD